MPSPAVLLAVRQHILANSAQFRSTFESKTVGRLLGELTGQRTKRVPKGFCAEDPAAELLKYKRYVLCSTLSPEIIATPRLFREIVARLEAMTPFVEFLDAPLVRKNPEMAREMTVKLANILRALLKDHDTYVPLSEELKFTDDDGVTQTETVAINVA